MTNPRESGNLRLLGFKTLVKDIIPNLSDINVEVPFNAEFYVYTNFEHSFPENNKLLPLGTLDSIKPKPPNYGHFNPILEQHNWMEVYTRCRMSLRQFHELHAALHSYVASVQGLKIFCEANNGILYFDLPNAHLMQSGDFRFPDTGYSANIDLNWKYDLRDANNSWTLLKKNDPFLPSSLPIIDEEPMSPIKISNFPTLTLTHRDIAQMGLDPSKLLGRTFEHFTKLIARGARFKLIGKSDLISMRQRTAAFVIGNREVYLAEPVSGGRECIYFLDTDSPTWCSKFEVGQEITIDFTFETGHRILRISFDGGNTGYTISAESGDIKINAAGEVNIAGGSIKVENKSSEETVDDSSMKFEDREYKPYKVNTTKIGRPFIIPNIFGLNVAEDNQHRSIRELLGQWKDVQHLGVNPENYRMPTVEEIFDHYGMDKSQLSAEILNSKAWIADIGFPEFIPAESDAITVNFNFNYSGPEITNEVVNDEPETVEEEIEDSTTLTDAGLPIPLHLYAAAAGLNTDANIGDEIIEEEPGIVHTISKTDIILDVGKDYPLQSLMQEILNISQHHAADKLGYGIAYDHKLGKYKLTIEPRKE